MSLNTNLEFDLMDAPEVQSPVTFEKLELSPKKKVIFARAVGRAKKYLASEAELLQSIIEIENEKIYLDMERPTSLLFV